MKNKNNKQISLFILICFTATFLIDFVIYDKGGLNKLNLVPLQMLIPALAAIAVLLITKEKSGFKKLGFRTPKIKYWFMGTMVILTCVLLSYFVSSFFISDLFISKKEINEHILRSAMPFKTGYFWVNISLMFSINILIGPVVNIPIFLGEELGWRGFLMPRLLQRRKKYAFIIGAVIWSLWHGPVIAMGHNYPGYPVIGNLLFILLCIPVGYILYYFYEKSGSIFVPAIMHGVLNKSTMMMVVYCVDEKKIQPLFYGAAGITGIVIFSITALILYASDRKASDKLATGAYNPIAL